MEGIFMYFTEFTVQNYKSYFEPQTIRLDKGINLIIGKNNAGKTALLEAISLDFKDQSHRSLKSLPDKDLFGKKDRSSVVRFKFAVNSHELWQFLMNYDGEIGIPCPDSINFDGYDVIDKNHDKILEEFQSWIFSADTLSFSIMKKNASSGFELLELPEDYPFPSDIKVFCMVEPDSNRKKLEFMEDTSIDSSIPFFYKKTERESLFPAVMVSAVFKDKICRFHAERFNAHTCPIDEDVFLKPDASNLPKVLSELPGKFGSDRFKEFNSLVHEIFPEIYEAGAESADNELSIWLWPEPPETRRDDLKRHLRDCGNGIGQVLGILYLIVTSESPRVIIIDEPTSFLHSTAARKLMEILSRYPLHQFIVATHSAVAINAVNVSTITRVNQKDGVSKLEPVEYVGKYGFQGWTVEEILTDVMELEDTRSKVYQDAIRNFDKALDEGNSKSAKESYDLLDKMLHPANHLRKLLRLQMITLEGGD
jgi:energy-coupling factor transporter ATP-binding protein EcfA2